MSKWFNKSIKTLHASNGIKNTDIIYAGQKIRIR
nr:LysM peptidoglycan-binding domain-containing protein [Bacillus swezeyi]